jgi:opacity protein-like surface antigen
MGGFYLGIGGSYNFTSFGDQDIYAVGTSDVYDNTGTLVQTGTADGPPAPIGMGHASTLAPSVQAGFFQRFAGSNWLWGLKFSYTYVNSSATTPNASIPQAGAFTTLSTNAVTNFTGYALTDAHSRLLHQFTLTPLVGYAFGRSFVYAGAGPTLSKVQTDETSLVGYAIINGTLVNVTGAPQDFSGTNWVYGLAVTAGYTYFLDRSWFVDASYTFTRTRDQTSYFSGTFFNPNGQNNTTLTGTLVGYSGWRVTNQTFLVTVNRLF